MSILKTVGYISEITTLPNGKTEVAKITLLSGKDQNEKPRYMNGSFIVTTKTAGIQEVAAELAKSKDDLLVDVEIKDIYGEASPGKSFNNKPAKLFINYRGLVKSIKKHEQKESSE